MKPLEKDDIQNIVSSAVDDAVDFIQSEIAEDRIKAQRYYDGQVDIESELGRSKVVDTKVRDTIRNIKPALMRVFLSTDRPVEFIPRRPDQAPVSDQATSYCSYKFNQCKGYTVLADAIHDALLKKIGVAKVYYEQKETSDSYEYTNLNEDEFSLLVNDPDTEVLEHTMMDENGIVSHDAKIVRRYYSGELKVESVPPEELYVDRNATSMDDFYIIGQRTEMRVGDLVAMGFEYDDVVELDGMNESDTMLDEEQYARQGYFSDRQEEDESLDPSMKMVMVCESYIKMDVEGTGIPVLHKVITGGSNHEVLDFEAVQDNPFAVFEADPEPHSFFGRSIADILINEQDATTSVLRGILDNVALTNNPQREIIEDLVNVDDVLNNEIGAIIRVKQSGAVRDLQTPFVAGQVLPFMGYLDQKVSDKTGISQASLGLDSDALQGATATAVKATVEGGAGQIEVIARNLAEGGFKRLFKLMLDCMIKNADDEEFIRLNGQFIPMDVRSWNSDMDMSVNVGLGTGKEQEKLAALQQTLQMQMQVYQSYGAQNPVVGVTNIRNTLADMLAMTGIRNSERYYKPVTPELEQQLLQQQQAQSQQQPPQDPAAMLMAQAEMAKAEADMVQNQLKQQQIQVDMAKLQSDEKGKYDKLQSEVALNAAKIEQGNIELSQKQQKLDMDKDAKIAELSIKLTELEQKLNKDLDTQVRSNSIVFDPDVGDFVNA